MTCNICLEPATVGIYCAYHAAERDRRLGATPTPEVATIPAAELARLRRIEVAARAVAAYPWRCPGISRGAMGEITAIRDALSSLSPTEDPRDAELRRLREALAEAEATIANERGEGEPPSPGWEFRRPNLTGWAIQDDSEHRRWCNGDHIVYRSDRNTWSIARGAVKVDGGYPTARAAMRALRATP